jgi:hypothetical protein
MKPFILIALAMVSILAVAAILQPIAAAKPGDPITSLTSNMTFKVDKTTTFNITLQKTTGDIIPVTTAISSNPIYKIKGDVTEFYWENLATDPSTKNFIMTLHSTKPIVQDGNVLMIMNKSNGMVSTWYMFDFTDLTKDYTVDFKVDKFTADIIITKDWKLDVVTLDPEFYSANIVNILGTSTCQSLKINATALGFGTNCTSQFSGANCTSIQNTTYINISQGGVLNLENCELRFNKTQNGLSINARNGSTLILNKANITTNATATPRVFGNIIISAGGNLTMQDSFISEMGWGSTTNQRGLEVYSPVVNFTNNTITGSYTGLYLGATSRGSVIRNSVFHKNIVAGIQIDTATSGNTTIQNVNISDTVNYAIYLTGGTYNNISNVFCKNATNCILASGVNGNNTFINNVTAINFSGQGFYIDQSGNITISNSVLINSTGSASYGIGVLRNGRNNFSNITISYMGGASVSGILVQTGGNNFNNITVTNGAGSGINLSVCSGNNLSDIVVKNNAKNGIIISTGSFGNNITNLISEVNSQDGIYVTAAAGAPTTIRNATIRYNKQEGLTIFNSGYVDIDGLNMSSNGQTTANQINITNAGNLILQNFQIYNCSQTGLGTACIYSWGGGDFYLRKGTMNLSASRFVSLGSLNSVNPVLLEDVQIINDSYFLAGMNISYGTIAALLNTTLTGTTDVNQQIGSVTVRSWKVDVFVNFSNGTAAEGVNVTWINSTDKYRYNTTNSTGWIPQQNLTQYKNSSGVLTVPNNYTFQANLSGFLANATMSWNVGAGVSTYGTGGAWGDYSLNNTRLTFTILSTAPDFSAPFIWLFSPNATYYNTTTLNLRYIVNQTGLDKTWYNYTSGNVTVVGNTTFTGTEGSNNFTLFANFTNGNQNSTPPFTINIDTLPPNVTIDSPSGTFYNVNPKTINGVSLDTGIAGLQNAWTNSPYFTGIDTTPAIFNFTNTSALPLGSVTVRVYVNDSYNNLAWADINFIFTPYTIPPCPSVKIYNNRTGQVQFVVDCNNMTTVNGNLTVTKNITFGIWTMESSMGGNISFWNSSNKIAWCMNQNGEGSRVC